MITDSFFGITINYTRHAVNSHDKNNTLFSRKDDRNAIKTKIFDINTIQFYPIYSHTIAKIKKKDTFEAVISRALHYLYEKHT